LQHLEWFSRVSSGEFLIRFLGRVRDCASLLRRLELVGEKLKEARVRKGLLNHVTGGAMAASFLVLAPGALAQEGNDMFAPRKKKPAENTPAAPVPTSELKPVAKQTGAWTIVLAAFRGDQQKEAAQEMLQHIAGQKELAGVFVEGRGEGRSTVVAVGRFADPSAPEALARLEKIRTLEVGGKRPYMGAFLAPPGELINLGQRPEYNLARAREQFGDRAQYSLQVAAYGRKDLLDAGRTPTEEDLKESRRAAEQAAADLRNQGELAFYFHGPRYSMVTVGVWAETDFARRAQPGSDERPRSENPELTALRQRFPHNLYNGAGVKVKTKDNREVIQASAIVKVPER